MTGPRVRGYPCIARHTRSGRSGMSRWRTPNGFSASTTAFTTAGTLAELEDNAGGFRFGGGLQVQLPGPLEGRVEYRRSQYNDLGDGTYGDATTDQVVAGVGVRF